MTGVKLMDERLDWTSNPFQAETVIALRGGHGSQAINYYRDRSPESGGTKAQNSLVDAIAIYSRSRLPK